MEDSSQERAGLIPGPAGAGDEASAASWPAPARTPIEQYELVWARHEARTFGLVRRAARVYGLSEDEIEDVLQETRLALFRALPRLGLFSAKPFLRGTIMQYVRGIVGKRAASAARDRVLRPETSFSSLGEDEVDIDALLASEMGEDVALRVLARLQSATLAGQLQRALERLPDKQRQAVELVRFREATYAQAAFVLGVSVGTVKSQVHDALKTLRGWAMAEGWGDET